MERTVSYTDKNGDFVQVYKLCLGKWRKLLVKINGKPNHIIRFHTTRDNGRKLKPFETTETP